jgi:hypothetical protein
MSQTIRTRTRRPVPTVAASAFDYTARDRQWFEQYEAIEDEIERLTAPLYAQLEALDDERCCCGKFADDDRDPHAPGCSTRDPELRELRRGLLAKLGRPVEPSC